MNPSTQPSKRSAAGDSLVQLNDYPSKVDGLMWHYGCGVTDRDPTPKPLILEVSPNGFSKKEQVLAYVEELLRICKAHDEPAIVVRPSGRGDGSVYQNYGEVDVFECIEHVSQLYPIDIDRIYILGESMGGAATFYLVSHYPDVFAAAGTLCGYCDYRLEAKPGGYAIPVNSWETPSWQSRSAAFLIENFEHTPIWMSHGSLDRLCGSGVPVQHGRQMSAMLKEKGFDYQYTEFEGVGHTLKDDTDIWQRLVPWMLKQRKRRHPEHVQLKTYGLRHNRSYWVTIDQMEVYGRAACVDATCDTKHVNASTSNVRTLSLGPFKDDPTEIVIDGQRFSNPDSHESYWFQRHSEGKWIAGKNDLSGQKRHGVSGPFSDMFFEQVILVAGSLGTEEENYFNQLCAKNAASFFKSFNGGVHRGGIPGRNAISLPISRDADLSSDDATQNNLLLYGTPRTNALVKAYQASIPFDISDSSLTLNGKTYQGDCLAAFAVFPHPKNENRYVGIFGGTTPEAMTYGSHIHMMLLPDYLVFDGPRVLEWGFWDNHWKRQTGENPGDSTRREVPC